MSAANFTGSSDLVMSGPRRLAAFGGGGTSIAAPGMTG